MLILSRSDVLAILDGGGDEDVCQIVRDTYVAHARRETAVPHSVFLRFPGDTRNRIIALPAFVGGARPVAGVKWVSSFPGNLERGLDRASAAILLNSVVDGRPVALIEAGVISARRTGAGAAVAAAELTGAAPPDGVSLIGCGVINTEVLRFLRTTLPHLARVTVFDLDRRRAKEFAARLQDRWQNLKVEVSETIDDAMGAHRLISLATTAVEPHLDTSACRPGSVLLHVSLRDLTPESILAARNVVDDADHVCRAATSLELAELLSGDRSFINAELGDLLAGTARLPYDAESVVVFSPFGLGALDAAVAAHVLDAATAQGRGLRLPDFAS